MYRLVFSSGKFKGRRLVIKGGSLSLGRALDNAIRLDDDPGVLPHHAVIEPKGRDFVIRALADHTRIWVNDREVHEHLLAGNDQVQLGRTRFTFQELESALTSPRRRVGTVQRLTYAAVGLVLVLEMAVVVGIAFIKDDVGIGPEPVVAHTASDESMDEAQALLDRPLAVPDPEEYPSLDEGAGGGAESELAMDAASGDAPGRPSEDPVLAATQAVGRVNLSGDDPSSVSVAAASGAGAAPEVVESVGLPVEVSSAPLPQPAPATLDIAVEERAVALGSGAALADARVVWVRFEPDSVLKPGDLRVEIAMQEGQDPSDVLLPQASAPEPDPESGGLRWSGLMGVLSHAGMEPAALPSYVVRVFSRGRLLGEGVPGTH